MDFHQLLIFSTVMKHRSFSRAAETLYLTQPTVSAHIKALEKELGFSLFERHGRRFRPTQEAQVLNEHARNLLALKEKALYAIQAARKKTAFQIEIATSSVPNSHLLPPVMRAFCSYYPQASFKIFEAGTKTIIKEIREGNHHFGLVGDRLIEENLTFTPFAKDKLILIASPSFADLQGWSARKELRLEECFACPFLLRPPTSGTRRVWEKALQKQGYSLRDLKIVAQITSTEAVREGVKAGLGVAVVSALSVSEPIKLGLLKGYSFSGMDLTRDFFLVSHCRRVLAPAVSEFIDLLLDYHGKGVRQ